MFHRRISDGEDFKGDSSSSLALLRAPASALTSIADDVSHISSGAGELAAPTAAATTTTTSSGRKSATKVNKKRNKSLIPTLDILRNTSSLSMNASNLGQTSGKESLAKSLLEATKPRRGLARSLSMLTMRYSGKLSASSQSSVDQSLMGVVGKDASRQITRITQHLFSRRKGFMSRQNSELNVNLENGGRRIEKRANSMLCISNQDEDEEEEEREREEEKEGVEDEDEELGEKEQAFTSERQHVDDKSLIEINSDKITTNPMKNEKTPVEEVVEQNRVEIAKLDKIRQQSNRSRIFTSSSSRNVSSRGLKDNKESKLKQQQEASKKATKSLSNNNNSSNIKNNSNYKNAKTNLSKFNKNHISLVKQNGLISGNKLASISNKLAGSKNEAKQEEKKQVNKTREQQEQQQRAEQNQANSPAKGFWQLR